MEQIRNLFIDIFEMKKVEPCRCGGAHEICLQCPRCRMEDPDQVATDFNDLAQYIDHTNLKADATPNQIKDLCREAGMYEFVSVCVNPKHVELASYQLGETIVCSVIGFPLGANITDTKVYETKKAIEQGAKEIDMVIDLSSLKAKHYRETLNDIALVAKACHKGGAKLKVILENCYLNQAEKIISCMIAKKAGADFVKTSTGFGPSGATVDDVALMREIVGPKMGVKAAGGIRDKHTAEMMLKAGANRIGSSRSVDIVR